MIEACVVGFPARSVCMCVALCNRLPKISWENPFEEVFGSPYISYTALHPDPIDETAVLTRWHRTVGPVFSPLERLRGRVEVGTVIRTRRHKEDPR
jgi:hypothetical protein